MENIVPEPNRINNNEEGYLARTNINGSLSLHASAINRLHNSKASTIEVENIKTIATNAQAGMIPMGEVANSAELLSKPKVNNHSYFRLDTTDSSGNPYIWRYDAELAQWINTKQIVYVKDAATKKDVQPIKVRDFFLQNSGFTNIPLDAIISIKALTDWSGNYTGNLHWWYVNNGNGSEKIPTLYFNASNADGTVHAGSSGILAQYFADNSDLKSGIEKIIVSEKNLSGVNIEIVINWDKIPHETATKVSSDTILDSAFLLQEFKKEPKNIELNNNFIDIQNDDIFLVNKRGDYISLPTFGYNDHTWTNGKAYSPTGIEASSAMCYSEPIRVVPGSVIKYPPIPSSKFCHVFLDADNKIVDTFGGGANAWDLPLLTKVVSDTAVNMVYSWAHNVQFSQHFKAGYDKDPKLLSWSDLEWHKGLSWKVGNKLPIVGGNELSISERVKVKSSWIETTMVPSGSTGFACFNKNGKFLGVKNRPSQGWDNLTKERLFHGTDRVSFTYAESEKDKFSFQETSKVDFSIEKEGLYQVHAVDAEFKIEPLATDSLGAAKEYTDSKFDNLEVGQYNYLENLPILPPQLFLRSDKPIFLYRKSMISSLANSQGFGVTLTSMGEKRKVIDIQEPTAIGYDDIDNVSTKFVVQQFNAINKMVYKDVKVYKVLVDTLIGKVVKIMSLGDSLSEGVGKWTGTPVCMLATILRALGIEVHFVGSLVREMMNKGVAEKISYEGRGGWRYPTLIGWESQFAGLNQIIPTDQTKSKWELGVDGASMNDIKINNPFLYPATAQDLIDYPEFCFHFVVGNTQLNKSYAEDKTLGTYHIFDPSRYFTLRNIEIPDILTMAFGTNEWYLNAYGGFNVDKATKSFEFIVRRFRQAAPDLKIIVIPAQPLMPGRDEQWRTQYSILCSSIMKAAESKIAAGDNKILVCPLYAQGSRFWSFDKFVGIPAELTTYNSVKEGVMDLNVHYNDNNDDESNNDHAEHLAACALNAMVL